MGFRGEIDYSKLPKFIWTGRNDWDHFLHEVSKEREAIIQDLTKLHTDYPDAHATLDGMAFNLDMTYEEYVEGRANLEDATPLDEFPWFGDDV